MIGRLALPKIKITEDLVASGKLVQLDFSQDAMSNFTQELPIFPHWQERQTCQVSENYLILLDSTM
jgi:hypothetical protein